MSFSQLVTFLRVTDLDRSTSFYRDTLGLEVVLDQGDCRILRVTDTAFIGICAREEPADKNSTLVTLVTDAVDAWHRSLQEANVPCEKAPQVHPKYNVYHAFYRDPDGYLIEVQQFLDPEWPSP
jgi:catechol 2,3-dioxygenase-like lactoylglutathione lyase family enzyme